MLLWHAPADRPFRKHMLRKSRLGALCLGLMQFDIFLISFTFSLKAVVILQVESKDEVNRYSYRSNRVGS